MLTISLRIVLKDLTMSSRSAYRRQLLPAVGVAVSMAAEAESLIKLACVHGESETFSTTQGVCGLLWCRGKEMRAKLTRRTREGSVPCIYSPKDCGAPVVCMCMLHVFACVIPFVPCVWSNITSTVGCKLG